MKIPYGLSNFNALIREDYFYIDKTDYIKILEEQGKYNILLRPRRFGKSLFLSSLQYYYDINQKDAFQALFGPLAIGKNPTPLRNSYQILAFDF
ncbi:MAG: AAA family ATPase, partial [Candidatus Electrothrix sp. AR3]|nr:AAA family ATPase [Candidatus Electrothrix sp. AR3]